MAPRTPPPPQPAPWAPASPEVMRRLSWKQASDDEYVPNWAAFKQYNRPCESCTTAKQPCRIRALRYLPRWGWVQEDCLPCAESGAKCSRSVLVTQLAVQMPAVDVVRVEKIGLSKSEVLGLVRTAARGGSVDLAGLGGDASSAARVTRAHAEEAAKREMATETQLEDKFTDTSSLSSSADSPNREPPRPSSPVDRPGQASRAHTGWLKIPKPDFNDVSVPLDDLDWTLITPVCTPPVETEAWTFITPCSTPTPPTVR